MLKGNKIILILTSLTIVTRLIPALGAPVIADMAIWWQVGIKALSGMNPYLGLSDHPRFPPVWVYLSAPFVWLSATYHIPFGPLIKILPIFSDICIAVLMFKLTQRRGKGYALLAGLVYAISPIAIFITGFQGQFDTLPVLMILLAIFFFKKHTITSALFLGAGIAFKSFPILVLPLFLLKLKQGILTKIIFSFIAILPVSIILIPFMLQDFQSVYTNVFGHSGSPDHGWMAILRASYWLSRDVIYRQIPYIDILLNANKIIFFIVYGIVLCFVIGKNSPLHLDITIVFLLFCFIYGGVASQYLLWSLPFLLLFSIRLSLLYSFFATISLLGYYIFFLPRLILWAVPFITISSATEQAIKHSVIVSDGNISSYGSFSFLIKLALVDHIIATLVFWIFLGWLLFKKLLPACIKK